MDDKKQILESEEVEIHGTIFTIHSLESENAKSNSYKLIKSLILNNIDSLKTA